jgi:hypothetical protein
MEGSREETMGAMVKTPRRTTHAFLDLLHADGAYTIAVRAGESAGPDVHGPFPSWSDTGQTVQQARSVHCVENWAAS